MKKAIIAMAVMFVAAVSQAGSVNWNSGSLRYLTDSTGADYSASWQGQTMYFFLTPDLTYDTSALVTSLAGGGSQYWS